MSSGTRGTLPSHTGDWASAVAAGFYGAWCDTVEDDYYTIAGEGGGGGDPVLSAANPNSLPVDSGGASVVLTGANLSEAGGSEFTYPGGSAQYAVTVDSANQVTVTGVTGPGNADSAGAGTVRLVDVSWLALTDALPFTWTAVARNLADFNPKSLSLAASAGGFDLTLTGTFPDAAGILGVMLANAGLSGVQALSASVTKDSESQLTAHFADTGTAAEGVQSQVVVFVGNQANEQYYPGSGMIDWTA